jgi:hypothetical protein
VKTYRNEDHGFEIEIPEEWSPAPSAGLKVLSALSGSDHSPADKDSFQYGCYDEAFNFVIGPLVPVPTLIETERDFRQNARFRGFSNLEFGRITVDGRKHVWARYLVQDRWGPRWNKKYILVFDRTQYSLTATCNDPAWFGQREKNWDAIVASFRLLLPAADSIADTVESPPFGLSKKPEIPQDKKQPQVRKHDYQIIPTNRRTTTRQHGPSARLSFVAAVVFFVLGFLGLGMGWIRPESSTIILLLSLFPAFTLYAFGPAVGLTRRKSAWLAISFYVAHAAFVIWKS